MNILGESVKDFIYPFCDIRKVYTGNVINAIFRHVMWRIDDVIINGDLYKVQDSIDDGAYEGFGVSSGVVRKDRAKEI